MKNKIVLIVLAGLISLSFACHKNDGGVQPGQTDNPPSDGSGDNKDSIPDPAGSFDYSKMASHPRLLLTKGEEDKIKQRIKSNPDLNRVNDWVLQSCNDILGKPLLTYKKTGKRLLSVSREALKRIYFLSYGYRMTGNYAYYKRAEEEMKNVCGFSDWNPTHFLDVGEMALAVSIGYDWLYDELDDDTKDLIREALIDNAIKPSQEEKYNKSFIDKDNNWNQVCNTGILFAALATYESNKQLSVDMIERYLNSIKIPLATYAPDGNYTEGYNYWSYGNGFQVLGLVALNTALGSDKGLSQSPGFLETGKYFEFMEGPEGTFNYSDATSNKVANPFLFWFAKQTGDLSILWEEMKKLEGDYYEKNNDEARLLPSLFLFARGMDLNNITPPKDKIWIGDGKNPVILIRTDWTNDNSCYVGIKGGKASNSHGHMDAGSFVFDAGGARWAMDLGLQSYITLESKGVDLWNMSQNSQRWQVFRLNNYVHNTLTINGHLHNVDGKATIIKTFTDDDKLGGTLDMSRVFSEDLKDATREIVLIDQDYLQVTDVLTTGDKAASVTWRMTTAANAKIINANTIQLTQGSKVLDLIVDEPADITLKTWTNDPDHSYDAPNPGSRRVGFETTVAKDQQATLKVRLVPQ